MRAYAMLLGLVLTAGYAYAAQVAVASVSAGRAEAAAPAGAMSVDDRLGSVWYGGVLDPITVEARGDNPAKTAAIRRLLLDAPAVRCSRAGQGYGAIL